MFFQAISNLLNDEAALKIAVTKDGETLTVAILPEHGSENITPLQAKGTPEELDSHLVEALNQYRIPVRRFFSTVDEASRITDQKARLAAEKNAKDKEKLQKTTVKAKSQPKQSALVENEPDFGSITRFEPKKTEKPSQPSQGLLL